MLFCGSSYLPLHLLINPPLKSVTLKPPYKTHLAKGFVSFRWGQVWHCSWIRGGRGCRSSGSGVKTMMVNVTVVSISVHMIVGVNCWVTV